MRLIKYKDKDLIRSFIGLREDFVAKHPDVEIVYNEKLTPEDYLLNEIGFVPRTAPSMEYDFDKHYPKLDIMIVLKELVDSELICCVEYSLPRPYIDVKYIYFSRGTQIKLYNFKVIS